MRPRKHKLQSSYNFMLSLFLCISFYIRPHHPEQYNLGNGLARKTCDRKHLQNRNLRLSFCGENLDRYIHECKGYFGRYDQGEAGIVLDQSSYHYVALVVDSVQEVYKNDAGEEQRRGSGLDRPANNLCNKTEIQTGLVYNIFSTSGSQSVNDR